MKTWFGGTTLWSNGYKWTTLVIEQKALLLTDGLLNNKCFGNSNFLAVLEACFDFIKNDLVCSAFLKKQVAFDPAFELTVVSTFSHALLTWICDFCEDSGLRVTVIGRLKIEQCA